MGSKNYLNLDFISKTRQNHALEHATLHILAKKNPGKFMGGHSDFRGIRIIGDVATEDIKDSMEEALARLKAGESRLAVHPNCGTNYAVMGLLGGSAAWLGMLGTGEGFNRKLERLPFVITLVTLALILARPLGPVLQEKVTTDAKLKDLQISEIMRFERNGITMHRILTL